MRILIFANLVHVFFIPSYAVTTKMFKVLDTCARYRLGEIDSLETIEKLKLSYEGDDSNEAQKLVKKYCSVFTPNEKIEF